jgi:2-methylisocitrate lyase-like PEP mutase family enzyme
MHCAPEATLRADARAVRGSRVVPLTPSNTCLPRSPLLFNASSVIGDNGPVVPETSQERKGAAFRTLHEGAAFVIPNPWDAGSAKVFAALGFEALATTSSGFAFTLGRLDGEVTLEEVVEHTRAIDAATNLPVSVDLENGYGPDPQHAARAISRVTEAGAVGGSIEDYDPDRGIYGIEHATERVAAAVEAAGHLDFPFTLTARSENYIRGNPDLDDTIARLQAYERAGAHVLYAPRIPSAREIRAIREATSKPLNVLAGTGLSVAEIVEAGGQRVSVGGRLAWVAINSMAAAAEQLRDGGDWSSLADPAQIIEWLSA